MTNFLLGLILFLLVADALLRAWFAKEDARRGYVAPCEVETVISLVFNEKEDIIKYIREHNHAGYELVQVIPQVRANNKFCTMLIFTKKENQDVL